MTTPPNKPTVHEHKCDTDCVSPGMQMSDDVTFEFKENHGLGSWIARQKIGYLFGSEVEGECQGIGATKEQALERLAEDKRTLYESLWI